MKVKHLYQIIFILILVISCKQDDDNKIDSVIDLEITDTNDVPVSSVLANGESLIVLMAIISNNADDEIQTIEFNKSSGEFLGTSGSAGVRPIDDNGIATITVKVPNKVERLFFDAKVVFNAKTYTKDASIEAYRAFPDTIIIEPSAVTVEQPASVVLDVYLKRTVGKVSEDTPAEFKAFQRTASGEEEVGRFTGLNNALTNEDGLISVTFHTDTGDINTDIPVTIKVNTLDDNANNVTSYVLIQVN